MKLQKRTKIILISIAAFLLLVVAGVIAIWNLNKYYLELNIQGETITLEYGDEMPQITALCKGTLLNRDGTPVKTEVEGVLDYSKLGEYHVTFTASYDGKTLSEERTVLIVDTTAPTIELVSSPEHYTSPVGTYQEEGYKATDNYDGDITDQVVAKEHDGVVTYTVTDASGNTTTIDRQIIYKDVIAPVITLTNGSTISVNKGAFKDPGFTATDECDGDITANVTVEGTVDGNTYGTYTLTYRVTDSSGNVSEVKRTVKVADITAPVITLNGEKSSYVKVGTSYADPGYGASDNVDGDLTSKVSVSGGVDTSKMGRNVITYTVNDNFGNKTTVERVVYVYDKQAVSNPVNPGNKVVYLTFDDGPNKYTGRLLDILDKYGVKATFFVTNQRPEYRHLIGETHRRGHTVALHTASHNYASVYASEDAYYKDLSIIHDIVVQQTGVTPFLVRFPGGTSNTVSRKYCRGIMSAISQSLAYHGYLYCDWNVSSGDAGGANTRAAVVSNVINGIKNKSVSVVLQHDNKGYSVEAVDEILFWGIQNGYTFLPMTETTPMVHFKPQN